MKKCLARCLIKMLKKPMCLLVMLTVHFLQFMSGVNYVDGVSIMTD